MADLGIRPKSDLGIRPKASREPDLGIRPKTEEGGWVVTAAVSPDELKSIAEKHGVATSDLSDLVGWYGGLKKDGTGADLAKFVAGTSAEAFAVGLPQFLYKKTQAEPMQKAIDDLASLIDQKKSTLQKGTELAGSVVGGLGLAKGVAKVTGAGLAKAYALGAMPVGGAVAGLTESKTGEELSGAALGGAIGVALPVGAKAAGSLARLGAEKAAQYGLTKSARSLDEAVDVAFQAAEPKRALNKTLLLGQKSAQDLTPQELKQFLGTATYRRLRELTPPGTDAAPLLRQQAQKNIENIRNSLVKERGAESWDAAVRDLGPQELEKTYDQWFRDKTARKVAKKLSPNLRKLTGIERAFFTFLDAKPVYEIIDKRLGTTLARSQDVASQAVNQFDTAVLPLTKKAEQTLSELTPESSAATIREIESGDVTSALGTEWSEIWARAREAARDLGVSVRERANYVPQLRLPLAEYKTALASRAKDRGLTDPELLSELERITGSKVKNPTDAANKLGTVLADDGSMYNRVDLTASVTKARDEGLPDWLRDKNMASLYNRWTNSVKRQAALQPHVQNMKQAIQVADAAGDVRTAEYLKGHLDDLMGNRQDLFTETARAAVSAFRDWSSAKAQNKALAPIDRQLEQGKARLPLLLKNELAANVYANGLGFNPRSALQNAASPFTMALGELGPDLGTKLWAEAQADLAKIVKDGVEIKLKPALARQLGRQPGETITTRNINLLAYNEGLMGPGWRGELSDAAVSLDKKTKLAQALGGARDAYQQSAMAAFSAAEKLGRSTVALMGQRLAKELQARPELIDQAIKSPAYRSFFKRMRAEGASPDQWNQEVVRYLNGHTLLNYDKLNMSEYGRRVGPLFRQFTKFPSYVLGRQAQNFYDKGIVAGGADLLGSYVAPFLGFHLIDQALEMEDSPAGKTLLGTKGFKGWDVGSASLPIVEAKGGLLNTPFVRTGIDTYKAGKAALSGDRPAEDVLQNWAQKAYSTYGYGNGLLRFLGEDVPSLVYEQEVDTNEPVLERRFRSITEGL